MVAISRCRNAIGGAVVPSAGPSLRTLRLRARYPCLCFAYRKTSPSHSPSKANYLTSHTRAIHMLGA